MLCDAEESCRGNRVGSQIPCTREDDKSSCIFHLCIILRTALLEAAAATLLGHLCQGLGHATCLQSLGCRAG